jgi:glutamyl-tRNA reductase
MKSVGRRLVLCGINHKHSTLEQREPLQLGHEELASANAGFSRHPQVLESFVVSTCNRVEFYFVTGRDQDPFEIVADFFGDFKNVDIKPLAENFRTRKGIHAADHLFRVAAGIDSMVLGENQIVSQLKEAYSSACAVKAAGKVIHRLVHQAFRVGKQVRSDTEMGKGACSVSSAAVELLNSKIQALTKPSILFIGVNQMIKLAASRIHLIDSPRFRFANRTEAKAAAFAEKFDGEGFGLDRLPDLMSEADVVFTCTSSSEPIITRSMIDEVLSRRKGRRLIIMDLAIPRDVDYPHGTDSTIEVYDLEDIKDFVKDQQEKREQAIPQAEEIIDRKLTEFDYWWQHVKQEPLYNGQAEAIESIREEELTPLLDKIPPEVKGELNEITRRMVQRVLHAAGHAAPSGKE